MENQTSKLCQKIREINTKLQTDLIFLDDTAAFTMVIIIIFLKKDFVKNIYYAGSKVNIFTNFFQIKVYARLLSYLV